MTYQEADLHGVAESHPADSDSISGSAESVPLVITPRSMSVVTRMLFGASAAEVWKQLMCYEQIDQRPPVRLRLRLPVSIRTVGRKSEVGDDARCLFEGGYLVKRVTEVEIARRYAFEIIEHELDIDGGMRLAGGEYQLDERAPDSTEVGLTTHYVSGKWPRWRWAPIEAAVCHTFHQHIFGAMRRNVERR